MQPPAWLAPLQALVENRLDGRGRATFIALIGDHPSSYARSPRIWTPALEALEIDAAYLALDVLAERLPAVVGALRRRDCLGANVTVPYKMDVLPLLDAVDDAARAAGAVNTITSRGGRLIGSNTDGAGLVAALLGAGGTGEPVALLDGATVLLIGAGGAGRAAAVALAPGLGTGRLLVTNRHHDRAIDLAALAAAAGAQATAVPEGQLDEHLSHVDLVINASSRGQAGVRVTAAGWTSLERYSALAPATPALLSPMPEEVVLAECSARSAADITANHAVSRRRVRSLPAHAVVFDMVYAPAETVMLRHARDAGLRAANGREMNIHQAAIACVDHICRDALATAGWSPVPARAAVVRIMSRAWEG
jgi:shikimate dehydrogenase